MLAAAALLTTTVVSAAGITYTSPAQIPSALVWSNTLNKFIVGSTTRGDISTVDNDGVFKTIIPNIVPSLGTFGVNTDAAGNIYACISDLSKFTATGISAGAVSYVTKYTPALNQTYLTKLPNNTSWCNDLKVLSTGAVVISDTGASAVIYISATGVVTSVKQVTGTI